MDVTTEAIRTQLDRILTSPGFVHSDRMARFLRFAVEQTIQGQAESIKESVLGMEVFDRTASFDPRTDTIVRVEARRLRSKLKEYYETHGQHDSILIEFPKGSYVPTFLKGNGLDGGKLSTKAQASLVDETKSSNEPIPMKRYQIPNPGLAAALGFLLITVTVGLTLWLTRTPAPVYYSKLTRLTPDLGLTYQPTVSRDGKFLAFASDRAGEGNLDIWVKSMPGGEPRRLTRNQADDHEPAFSPDGSKVVFRSERDGGGIYAVSVLGGDERLIAVKGRQPRFSPDGTQIAYWTGIPLASGYGRARGVTYLIPSSGGKPRELEPRFSVARSPVWSPDGRHLLLLGLLDEKPKLAGGQERDGQHDWWVVSLDSKVAVRTGAADLLADHDSHFFQEMEPSDWIQTSDGHSILFARTMGEASNIWQVNISPKGWQITGPARQLTSGTATETYPSFSARGLVFADLASNSDIWSLPIDANQGKPTGPLEVLVQSAAEDTHSSLSRDGKTLAWNSGRSGYPDIWVKDLPSGKEYPITEGPGEEGRVLLSPDGSKLAYMVRRERQLDFYLAELGRGSSAERLCENCGGSMLDWSPDGKELLYWWGNPIRFSLLNVGSRKSQLVLQHPKYDLHRGQISPDGKWLAFSIPVESQSFKVLVTPLRKTEAPREDEWIEVATQAGSPHWSPDGNLLYFVYYKDGFWCLGAQALDPHTRRPVGSPMEVLHFHSARRSLTHTLGGTIGLSLSADRMVFSMADVTGNIWLAESERQ